MAQNSIFGILISIVVIASILFSGCTGNTGKIVTCSNYYLITDSYKTPSGEFITVEGYGSPMDVSYPWGFGNFSKGQYVRSLVGSVISYNLTRLNESDSGLRDACRVEP